MDFKELRDVPHIKVCKYCTEYLIRKTQPMFYAALAFDGDRYQLIVETMDSTKGMSIFKTDHHEKKNFAVAEIEFTLDIHGVYALYEEFERCFRGNTVYTERGYYLDLKIPEFAELAERIQVAMDTGSSIVINDHRVKIYEIIQDGDDFWYKYESGGADV